MLDIFHSDKFGVVEMTALVNKQPYVPGQIGRSGLFDSAGVSKLTVAIEERHGDLALVAPSPRGGPGETTDNEKRNIRSFDIPHFQRDDAVTADEVQGVRKFGADGSVDQVEVVEDKIAEKMRKHTIALDATIEHQRCGALKGLIVDKNGNVLYDLYDVYKLTAPDLVEFDFSATSFPFRKVLAGVQRSIEDSLDEDLAIQGIDAWCGPDYFEAALGCQEYRSTYLGTPMAGALQGNAYIDSFSYGGVNFMRYRTGRRAVASAAAQTGNSPKGYIGPNEVRFVPRIQGLFLTRFAPADYMETVNTVGLPRYAKVWPDPNGKRANVEVQTNAMSWCTRPEALRGGFAG